MGAAGAGMAEAGAAAGAAAVGAAAGVAAALGWRGGYWGGGWGGGYWGPGWGYAGWGYPWWGWGVAATPVVVAGSGYDNGYYDQGSPGCWVNRRVWSQPGGHGHYLGRHWVNVCQ